MLLTCGGRSKNPDHRDPSDGALPEFRVAHIQLSDRVGQVVVCRDNPNGKHDDRPADWLPVAASREPPFGTRGERAPPTDRRGQAVRRGP